MDERVRAAIAVVAGAAAARAEERMGQADSDLRPAFEQFLTGVVACGFVAGVYLQLVGDRAEGAAAMVGPQSLAAYTAVARHLGDLREELVRHLCADEDFRAAALGELLAQQAPKGDPGACN